jgi:hypothetical protein
MKRRIGLTEGELHWIVKQSVQNLLKEAINSIDISLLAMRSQR